MKFGKFTSVIFLTLFACSNATNVRNEVDLKKKQDPTESISHYGNLHSMIETWKNDSCGCLKKRTVEMADSIISESYLIGQPIEKVRFFLGKENNIVKEANGTIHLYYFINSNCDSNGIVVGDKSSIELIFSPDGELIEFPDCILTE